MAFSYTFRLACLFVVNAGILQTSLELLLWLGSEPALRMMRSLPLRQRERVLYILQLCPFPIGLIGSFLWSVPQYLRYESNLAPEKLGGGFLALAFAVTTWICWSAFRGIRMTMRSIQFARACKRVGRLHLEASCETPILTVAESGHPIALVGLWNPFILISQDVEEEILNEAGLELAIDHERAHAAHLDNWRLLSLHLLPRLNLRLRNGDTWMQCWRRTAEWAADEEAVGDDRDRAFALAETLVAVVRSSRRPSLT